MRTVRELSGRHSLAGTQDAVVVLAGEELDRALRDAHDARAWAAAAHDAEFQPELEGLKAAYRSADAETWPR